MIWVRVSLLEGSDELRSTLLRLPPKRRLRRLLLLIYAARQPGGWPAGHKEARETPDVEDTTIRVRLDEDCEELAAHLEEFPRGLRSGRLLALAEYGLRVMRDDADGEPVCHPPKPTARHDVACANDRTRPQGGNPTLILGSGDVIMPDTQVLSRLVEKRGELAVQVQRLTEELAHLDATIRLFEPDYDVGTVCCFPSSVLI